MDKIKHTIDDVLNKASEYLHKKSNLDLIYKAYLLAEKQHTGQFRKSNDPYIQHPIEVAYMLSEYHAGPNTICAGLLHDVLEDTSITYNELADEFGEDVANIVEGVTKISKLKYMTVEKILAKTHQKILIAMAKDIRVILVKLVDRVHNMRTLEFQPLEKQKKIARETIDLYAPFAHRLGMYRIKAELEDLSLRYLDSDLYNQINELITNQREAREEDIKNMSDRLNNLLIENGIENFKIKGRIKNIYSVCEKMRNKNLLFEEIYDLMALRIIISTVEDCYHVLGIIHGEWNPIPGRFKDYIATPKPNLYQSLHTTIVGPSGKIYEIQIRTYEMDDVAEYGVAAHWSYKEENKNYSPQKEQEEISNKMRWYRDLLNYTEEIDDNVDPMYTVKEDIFSASVFVFTPKGDVLDFPNGSTPIDFAYRVHTEVGNRTVGAIVNGRIVPLTYILKTGDVVEIKTSPNFNGPVESWLKIVKTSHAKHKIISILNKRQKDLLINEGKNDFERTAKSLGYGALKIDDKIVNKYFSKVNINNLDDFYCEIGKKTLSSKAAINRIMGINDEKLTDEALIKHYQELTNKLSKRSNNVYGVIVDGLDKAQIKIASCCHPVFGDEIVGFVSKGQGIVVHRSECHNNFSNNQERMINVYWDNEAEKRTFETWLSIISFDRKNIIADIVTLLTPVNNLTISQISSNRLKNGHLQTKLKLLVDNITTLDSAILKINMIEDVYSIERIIK